MRTVFVTGCAGFIGSALVDRLLADNYSVIGFDNFSTGKKNFLENAMLNEKFRLLVGDVLDSKELSRSMSGASMVFHLAANADVRFGTNLPERDLQQNTIATFNVLEAMRKNQIKEIVFSSTGSVYGESDVFPTPENAPFPIQTSLYGASKIACEGLISAYTEGYDFRAWVFRFVSILGERYTHGHIYDFYRSLMKNSTELNVLGNGHQKKSYLYVQDCLDAIMLAIQSDANKFNLYNLGTREYVEVNDSIDIICNELNVSPHLIYSGGDRGWIGDNPFIFLDTTKIEMLGWKPKLSIREGIVSTVRYLKNNKWLFS
jgi:UDP-glucose 4-epimerase